MLVAKSIAPPRGTGDPFTLVDLGCGDGVALILAAAANPEARFIGVDAMPGHVVRGKSIITDIGLNNIELHCAVFGEAISLADATADYVSAQGVLAWVSDANRDALVDLAAAWLKPGGICTIGYNCYPGWGMMSGFQKLVYAIAATKSGTSGERFTAAVADVRASGAIDADVWDWLDPYFDTLPGNYFAHEYLNGHWLPCWSGDVITACAARDLHFAGQVSPARFREDLCYKAAWRDALDKIENIAAREIAADLLAQTWFRQDVYVKAPLTALNAAQAKDARMQGYWALIEQVTDESEYTARTPAGSINFDNAAARAIVEKLAAGPSSLASIPNLSAADLLNSIDALFIAKWVVPVDPPCAANNALAANARLAKGDISINAVVGAHGVMDVNRGTGDALSQDVKIRYGIG